MCLLTRINITSFRFLLALLAFLPLSVFGATYTFSGNSLPPCSTWNGAWSVSGSTYTCTASASLAAGDIIAPPAGITIIANDGWTLGGNNTIGTSGAPVAMQSTYGDINVNGGTTIHGNLSSGSGDISLKNTVVNGSVSGIKAVLDGGRISGNVSGQNGVTTINGTIIGGNVLATNGPVTLSGGSVTGSVISNCCRVETTNTNISGGVSSGRNTVSINGGTISGGIYSSGGGGIIINNATVTNGDITATRVPISINNSTIGSPVSLVDIENNNSISINNSTVNGSVTAANWPGSLTISGDSDVTISCFPEPVPKTPGVCDGTGGGTTVHHYEIDVPAAGLTCANTVIPVRACATNAAPCTANLATTATGITLTASAGTFVNSGGATISFTGTGGYLLSATNPATVTLGMSSPAGASLQCFRFEGTTRTPLASCQFEVKSTMFRFTVPNFSAGDGASFSIEAVRQDDHSNKCVSFTPAGGVKMWMERVNPNSGSKTLSLGYGSPAVTAVLPAAEPAAGNIPLVFDNAGNTTVGVNYLDVGQVRLRAKWNATEGTSTFVVKPYFTVSGLACGDGTVNPGATGPGGGKFCRAGDPFSAVVKAVASDLATATPNFGRETPAESVYLSAAQVSPVTVPSPPGLLLNGTSLAKDSGDPSTARSSNLSWSEVGVISLTPRLADGDYLGAGDVTGTPAPYVGRFYPHHFSTQVTPPMTCPSGPAFACPASRGTPGNGMSYARQPFSVIVSARNSSGAITQNYSNSTGYAKAGALAAVSALGGAAAPAGTGAGTLNAGAMAASSFADGKITLAAVNYAFTAPPGIPTDIYLQASESGGDGVTSRLVPNNTSEEGGIKVSQGRIRLSNVFGNGKVPLNMPVEAQFWSGNSWVRNTSDNTTLLPAAVASKPTLAGIGPISLTQGSGSIVLPATAAGIYDIGINLGSPGASFGSCVDGLTGGSPANAPWLRSRGGICAGYTATTYTADPTARATFGIYAPETRRTIHVRELY